MVSLSLNRLRGGHNGNGGTGKTTGSQSPIRNVSPGRVMSEAKAAPTLILRVLVLKARNLAAKDRNGTSDPYLVATLGDAKSVTHAVYKTLNPEWNVCFDLPMTGSQSLLLECVCWDKDRFGKDYLGEFDVALEEVFANGQPTQEPRWYKLRSSRKAANISGEVELQFSLLDPVDPAASPEQILAKFYAMAAVTPDADDDDEAYTLGRSGNAVTRVEDDADEDDEAVEPTSDETDDPSKPESAEKKKKLRLAKLKRKKKAMAYEFMHGSDVVGIVFLEISRITDLPPERNVTRTSFDMDPFVVASLGRKTYRTRVIRHNLNPVFDERMIFNVTRHEQSYSLSFAVVDRDKLSGNDFVGTASLELPELILVAPEADPETGLYRLPEIPDTTAQTPPPNRPRFKFPTSRSSSSASLNRLSGRPGLKPRKSSSSLLVNGMPVSSTPAPTAAEQGSSSASTASGPPPEAVTGSASLPLPVLNAPEASTADCSEPEADPELRPYDLALALKNKERWESKHNPVLHVRAKYMPYPALRQYFWRAMLKQYDADDSGRISKVELTTMLDTLGSTLKESTVDSFFQRFADQSSASDPNTAELTFDQAVICLEDQLEKASAKRSIWNSVEQGLEKTVGVHVDHHRHHLHLHHHKRGAASSSDERSSAIEQGALPTSASAANNWDESRNGRAIEDDKTITPPLDDLAEDQQPTEEHVVEIHECPICHQPRLHKKSDADIITHIATCASQDWRQVNSLVMAEFVTSSQAQRKWYSKVITKLSYGGYKLGANSANILVQDRITGQINEERMSVYVRLGIRLLYKGLKSREMEKKRIRKLLRSLSIKQGRKFDDPASAREIPAFINFHRLNLDEVLLPLEEFKTFNEFFYRRLKPDARPCSAPDNPSIVVSPADCRCVVFNRIEEATAIWIKGREFSVARLLGSAYPADAKRYANGALGVFRLAPQDYHRFHIPVDGVLDTPKTIAGEYYTVNPMAVRSALDVYGENVRVVVPIDSVAHGRVMVVCVGAMMVGSTVITATAGQRVQRADELGYFKFGGSTIVLLFEPGMVKFDEDLAGNSKGALETLVRAGMSIGHSPDQPPYTPDRRKSHPTREEQLDAEIRIGGAQQETSPLPAKPLPGSSAL